MLAYLVRGTFETVVAIMQRSMLLQRSTYASIWSGYCDNLRKRPILTKAATGVLGSIIGDGIAQIAESRNKPRGTVSYDAARASRLCTYAALIGSPVGHYWFQFLDKCIFPNAMSHPVTAVVKTLLDQALMAPAGIALFFTFMGVMEGNSIESAWQGTKEKFKPTLKANYILWPAANLVNFALVPPSQRILYCNVISVFWASFLSAMASKKGDDFDQVQFEAELAHKEL